MSTEHAKSLTKELRYMTIKVERLNIINLISRYEHDILEDALDIKDPLGLHVTEKQCDALDKIKQKINDLPLE